MWRYRASRIRYLHGLALRMLSLNWLAISALDGMALHRGSWLPLLWLPPTLRGLVMWHSGLTNVRFLLRLGALEPFRPPVILALDRLHLYLRLHRQGPRHRLLHVALPLLLRRKAMRRHRSLRPHRTGPRSLSC